MTTFFRADDKPKVPGERVKQCQFASRRGNAFLKTPTYTMQGREFDI